MRKLVFLVSLGLAGCGGGGPANFGSATPATGQITMQNSHPERLLSGLVFQNHGTGNITIDQFHTVLADHTVIDTATGVGVEPGAEITYLFDSKGPEYVESISFRVEGSTETLVVQETQASGIVPTSHCAGAGDCPSGKVCCFVWGVGGPRTGANQCITPVPGSPSGNGCPPNL